MQFSRLNKIIKTTKAKDSKSEDMVTLPSSLFLEILRAAVKSSPFFDEKHYLARRPDVVDALKKGALSSAREHYARTGYFEDIAPGKISIDEAYYLANNPDVATAFRKRQIKDPQQHFDVNGFTEGRLPTAGFSIWDKV